jgi:hypothetical protein
MTRSGTSVVGVVAGCVVACALMIACGSATAAVPLPDGRAWEMVSPLEKNGGEINGIGGLVPTEGLPEGGIVQASVEGSSITYVSLRAFPGWEDGEPNGEPQGAPLASQYLSTRKATGWSTEDLTTAVNDGTYPLAGEGAPYKAFSTDLSKGLMLNGLRPVENPPPPRLEKAAPPQYENYFLRDDASGSFEALMTSAPPEEPPEFFIELLGVTPDLSHIVFTTRAALTSGATRENSGRNMYEWADGQIQPVDVPPRPGKPGETEPKGGELGVAGAADEAHTISNDGSKVFWVQPASNSLFVRENIGQPESPYDGKGACIVPADACTIQIDATKIAEPKEPVEESGYGVFKTASADGSKVFFTDMRRLTPGSTAGGERAHQDLYMFDVETGQLTDLTVDGIDSGGASVLGVLEASEDGSYVYFVAEGALPGTGALAERDNLYVWHEGAPGNGIRFIATLSSGDNSSQHIEHFEPVIAHDWAPAVGEKTVRLSPDGQRLVFMSEESLTGYDNRDASTGLPDEEVYLYEAGSGRLTCLSCNPSGARPAGPSGIPGGTPWVTVERMGTYQSRVLDERGDRVFFDSQDALVPQDTNGVQDVYEWEQDGSGTCRREGGCVFLLSGGSSSSESSFVDASASGDDVFFITRAQLVAQDTDQLRDLYDARVGGGFPQPQAPVPCEGEGCRPPASPSLALGSLASATFSGVGNLSPASPKAAVKKIKAKRRNRPRKQGRRVRKSGRKASAPHRSHASRRKG